MRVHVADHPLVAHKLTALRDESTDSPTFRRLADELVTLLAYEATRDVRVQQVEVRTPVAPATGVRLSSPKPLVVPILRAGLGMLDGMVRLLPTAEVGFLGMVRDEQTLIATTYATWWRRRWRSEHPSAGLPEAAGPDRTEGIDERDVLWRALGALPRRQRAVVVLRYYEDLSEAETAAALGVSRGTVKSQASKALAALRRDDDLTSTIGGGQ